MNTLNTRDTTYLAIQEKLPLKRKKVVEALSKIQPASSFQIADFLQVRPNEVTGRITELRTYGFIKVAYEKLEGKMPREYYVLVQDLEEIKAHQNKIIEEKSAVVRDMEIALETLKEKDCNSAKFILKKTAKKAYQTIREIKELAAV